MLSNQTKKKRNGLSPLFIVYFLALLGFFAYMVIVNGDISIIPPFRFNDMSKEYWNWVIYQLDGTKEFFTDITYFVEVLAFAIGLIYMFANDRKNGLKLYFKNKFNLVFDLFCLLIFVALKVYLLTLPHYRLYMVLITPIFFNLFVIKFVLYSKKYNLKH